MKAGIDLLRVRNFGEETAGKWKRCVGLPEWLRGIIRNDLCYARVGSNPAADDSFFLFLAGARCQEGASMVSTTGSA